MAALSGVRMADGKYADGSWELKIKVTDLAIKTNTGETISEVDMAVLVTSELHIGGVIAKLVDALKKQYGKLICNFVFMCAIVIINKTMILQFLKQV